MLNTPYLEEYARCEGHWIVVEHETEHDAWRPKMQGTVKFQIGFISEHSMILFLTHNLCGTSPLWLALYLTPVFAHLHTARDLSQNFSVPVVGDVLQYHVGK
jgi:hypothetical protein